MGNPAKGWTAERRERQSEAIRRWKLWEQFTRPKRLEGKAAARGNAWTGGEWMKLRQAIKGLNQAMKNQLEWLS